MIISVVFLCIFSNPLSLNPVESQVPFDFIEFGIFENAADGNLSGNPGIVFRLYSNGELLYYDVPHRFEKFYLKQKTVKRLYKNIIKKIFFENDQYLLNKKGDLISLHGGVLYLKCKRNSGDLLVVSNNYPHKGALLSFLKKIQKLKNKSSRVSSDNTINEYTFFEIAGWLSNQKIKKDCEEANKKL